VLCADENKVIGHFSFEEPMVTANTFLVMTVNTAESNLLVIKLNNYRRVQKPNIQMANMFREMRKLCSKVYNVYVHCFQY